LPLMSILQNKVLPVCLGSHRPIVQDDGDGDAGSLDTRLPVAEVRVADDPVAPIDVWVLHSYRIPFLHLAPAEGFD
jgi:hypothetical protein